MPFYDYKCLECDRDFSQFQSVGDELEHCVCKNKTKNFKRVYNFSGKIKEGGDEKVGEVVRDFIEESREGFKEHLKELKKERK